MANEGGQDVVKIKSVGESDNGKRWVFETDKGKFNLSKKGNENADLPALGKEYTVHWSWYEFTIKNEPAKMRMINDWFPVGAKAPVDSGPNKGSAVNVVNTQNTGEKKHEGWRTGQAYNLGVQMAITKMDVDDPKFWGTAKKYADQVLENGYDYEKNAGTFEVPF